jgi:hypothetical protein
MSSQPPFLSGESGIVGGRRQLARARLTDALNDLAAAARLQSPRLGRAASHAPQRKVAVTGVYSKGSARTMAAAVTELERGKHEIEFALGSLDSAAPRLSDETRLEGMDGGKFANVNALLERIDWQGADWVVVIDDDVQLPSAFLDRFLFVAERFELQLVQPALTHASHAAWRVVRRERGLIARRTRMVEIGPLTAFHSSLAGELLPFPPLEMGWGLDSHWGALALEHGWRLGVVDATVIRHEQRRTAATYDRRAAISEAERFLAGKPHLDASTALEVVERHKGW